MTGALVNGAPNAGALGQITAYMNSRRQQAPETQAVVIQEP